jgi:hypothetical protein
VAINSGSLAILAPHSQSSSNGLGTGESGVLQDGSVTVGSGTSRKEMAGLMDFQLHVRLCAILPDDANIVGVLDGGKDSSSEDDLAAGPEIEGERNQ